MPTQEEWQMATCKVECGFCGSVFKLPLKSESFHHVELFKQWKVNCLDSLTKTLGLEPPEVQGLETSECCSSCLEILRELDFLFRGIRRFEYLLASTEHKLRKLMVDKKYIHNKQNQDRKFCGINVKDEPEIRLSLKERRKRYHKIKKDTRCDRLKRGKSRMKYNNSSGNLTPESADFTSMPYLQISKIENDLDEGDKFIKFEINEQRTDSNDNTDRVWVERDDLWLQEFICPVTRCRKIFAYQHSLLQHMKLEHKVKQERQRCNICHFCGLSFPSGEIGSSDCSQHEKLHHESNIPYTCVANAFCHSTFANSHDLKKHVIEHHEETTFSCDLCPGKFFGTRSRLHSHKSHFHPRGRGELQCSSPGCSFTTMSKSTFQNHQLKHISARPFICNECGASYSRPSVLKRHMFLHTGEVPFKCKYCEKGFNMSHKLKNHEETHALERNYLCSGCGKAFRSKKNLQQHARLHCPTSRKKNFALL